MQAGGDFFLELTDTSTQPDHVMLIGGGVGINPLLSMMLHIRHRQMENKHTCTPKVTLIYSAKTSDELLFKVKS